jgi:terminase, large subunit
MEGLASEDSVIAGAMEQWRPPPRRSLSEWADENFYLSPESSAEVGRWKTIAYQREPMDCITDPRVRQVTMKKSARVGFTKACLNAAIGYFMHQRPSTIMVVQPTEKDAKGFSKEEIAPMLRDVPVLSQIVFEDSEEETGPKGSGNTILHKKFPGGVFSIAGANSGAGFRRISRRAIFLDEIDAYPLSAGQDGDPVKLAIKRGEYYHDRIVVGGSTPLLEGTSRISQLFLEGDQRYYYVPCPECGHMDHLAFDKRGDGESESTTKPTPGHVMDWQEGKPEEAYFICSKNGCVIEHRHKRSMIERGEWRASKPFEGHASFHIWTAYSLSPNATWGHIAKEYEEARKAGPEQERTFVNTTLGETWKEKGEAPDWQRLYLRRELYPTGTVPAGPSFLTCGIDVQKDRFIYEIVGWKAGKESWSVDAGVIPCDTGRDDSYLKLDELISRTFETPAGPVRLLMTAIDSGYNSQQVYYWARRHVGRVIAVKGTDHATAMWGVPTDVDVHHNGVRITRGCKVWPVGSSIAKTELYGWLRIDPPTDGGAFPKGFCHFPQYGEDYFKQLTAEHLVKVINKRTFLPKLEWHLIKGRENHWLDCRVYARVAAGVAGLDRLKEEPDPSSAPAVVPVRVPVIVPGTLPVKPKRPKPDRSDSRFHFLGKRGRGGWLKR